MPPKSPFLHALACLGQRSDCQAVVISFSLFFLFSHHNKQGLTHSTVAMKQRRGESGSRLRGISSGPTGWGRCSSLVKLNSSLFLQKKKTAPPHGQNSSPPIHRLLKLLCVAFFFQKISRLSSTHFAALMFFFHFANKIAVKFILRSITKMILLGVN